MLTLYTTPVIYLYFDELAERFVRAVYAQQLPERSDFEAAERALAAFEPLIRV